MAPQPHHRLAQEMGDLDGVTCFCELAVPLASRLCERLGLATNSPQVGAERARSNAPAGGVAAALQDSRAVC